MQVMRQPPKVHSIGKLPMLWTHKQTTDGNTIVWADASVSSTYESTRGTLTQIVNRKRYFLIEGEHISVMLFYVDIWAHLIGKYLARDEILGVAQDISQKYGGQMKPHVHLTVVSIDPEYLI